MLSVVMSKIKKPTWAIAERCLEGNLTIKGSRFPKAMLIGLVGVILMYVGTAGIVSVVGPWWVGKGDAPRHVDYVYRIWHGQIPKFTDGITYPPLAKLGAGRYVNQPASANPPLFYLLHAPLVGPLLDKGEWHKAEAVGRAFNIFLGVLCVIALSWGGWLLGGKRKDLFAVSVPALAVLTYDFTFLNMNYALDVLLVLLTTLGFIVTYKLLEHGPKRKYLFWLAVVSILGMSTKASYIVILAISLLGLIISWVIHGKKRDIRKNALRGTGASALILGLVVLAIGWFYYYHNYKVTGRWYSNYQYLADKPHRPYKSLLTVLRSKNLWALMYGRYSVSPAISVALSSFSLAGILTIVDKNRFAGLRKVTPTTIMAGLLALATIGIFLTQIVEAVGSGNYYFRYMLPAILPISLAMCYGLLAFHWTRGMLVFLFATMMTWSTIYGFPKSSTVSYTLSGIKKVAGPLNRVYYATAHNGIPTYVDKLLFLFIMLGVIALFLSLIKLSRRAQLTT